MTRRRYSAASLLWFALTMSTAAFVTGRHLARPAAAPTMAAAHGDRRRAQEGRVLTPSASADEAPIGPADTISSAARLREACEHLEREARTNPAAAMARALGETNLVMRDALRNAVLRGWADVAPHEASAWIETLAVPERPNALDAMFSAPGLTATDVVESASRFAALEPSAATAYTELAVRTLARRGDYREAVACARVGPADDRGRLVNTAFAEWATYQPETAYAAAQSSGDPAAVSGAVTGWATANPAALATFAETLSGAARSTALTDALPAWVHRDPAAALAWIDEQPPSVDLDAGISSVATLPNLVATRPDIAIQCAAMITDPALRGALLRMLAQSWSERDARTAAAFVSAPNGFPAPTLAALREGLAR